MTPRISSTRLTVTIGWMAGMLAALIVLPALASRTTLDLTPGAHQRVAQADHGFGQFTTNVSRWVTSTAAHVTHTNAFGGGGRKCGNLCIRIKKRTGEIVSAGVSPL